jgi:hypothetical protein
MPNEEVEVFRRTLAGVDSYLELGGGGSTLTAIDLGVRSITTIDSDVVLLDILQKSFNRIRGSKDQIFVPLVAFSPGIGKWGYPLGKNSSNFLEDYLALIRKSLPAQVVLIDGRFRLASFLEIAEHSTRDVTVLWDDYLDRSAYHQVETFFMFSKLYGRMAMFKLLGRKPVPAKLARMGRRDKH